MTDFSWLGEQRPLTRLLHAAGVPACWDAGLSRQTAGIEVEAARFRVLVPFARPVPLAVMNPLAVLGQFTPEAAAVEENGTMADAGQSAPPSPTTARPRPMTGQNGLGAFQTRPPQAADTHLDLSGPPVAIPEPDKRRALPHRAWRQATAAHLQALAGTLPADFSLAAPAGQGPRGRPSRETSPGQSSNGGKQRLPPTPPPDGLSLLAHLTQAPAGAAPPGTPTTHPAAGRRPAPPDPETTPGEQRPASADRGRRARPGQATAPGQPTTGGSQRLPPTPPPDGLSLLAHPTQAPAGVVPGTPTPHPAGGHGPAPTDPETTPGQQRSASADRGPPRARPGQATAPGQPTTGGSQRLPPTPTAPPDGLSLLAYLTQAQSGARLGPPTSYSTSEHGPPPPDPETTPGGQEYTPHDRSQAAGHPAEVAQGQQGAAQPDTPALPALSGLRLPLLLRAFRSPLTPGTTFAGPGSAAPDGSVTRVATPHLAALLQPAMFAGPAASPPPGRADSHPSAEKDRDSAARQPGQNPAGEPQPPAPFAPPATAQAPPPVAWPRSQPDRTVGLDLLRRTVSSVRSAPSRLSAASETIRPDVTKPAAPPSATAGPTLAPAPPAVQNTFNVQVHMEGSPAGEEELAARLNRILVEQARRFGIDV